MGMIKSDLKIVLDERDIKAFAIVADNNLVSLDVLDKIIQVLSMDIGFNLMAVIKRYGCYRLVMAIQPGCFYIQVNQ